MENQEFAFAGKVLNGIGMLIFNLLVYAVSIALIVLAFTVLGGWADDVAATAGIVLFIVSIIMSCGFVLVEPGEARVMMFFGKYRGTFTRTGYSWVHPFLTPKKLSLRARNLDAEPIKVNDKTGNPVMIGMVLVWKLKDTYKAMFDIDAQTMAESKASTDAAAAGAKTANIMNAFEKFVRIQADAALRQVAGQYAYDDGEQEGHELTLRDGSDEINKELEAKIDERLAMAGIEVIEARINYLAYAPEIAAVMLRRQQATAIIAAREKIVEGAVSMVKMALDKLSADDIVDLDEEKKAAMVSNLLVVLCGDDTAQPVINTGTLNH